jgi:hypothetical protein
MSKKLYHVFGVADYKGGELTTDVNLTKKDLILYLMDALSIDDYVLDSLDEKDRSKNKKIAKLLNAEGIYDTLMDRLPIYAAGEGVVFEVFTSVDGGLDSYGIDEKIVRKVIKKFLKNLEE